MSTSGSASASASRGTAGLLAAIVLAAAVAWIFDDHLLGRMTFPWDFQGGYYTNAVARMRDGSFWAPPLWLPWGGFGLPGYLSLQDGTWYLPQWLYDLLGIRYDMVGATRLQVAHVFMAGLGTWFLCRWLRCSPAASMLAATATILSGSFFSNAQHVDIVRGAAMLPWMVLAVDWCMSRRHPLSIAVLALLAWQFLVGAYPGQIVALAYCLPVLAGLRSLALPRRDRLLGLGCLTVAAVLAVGLSAVKFLPVALDLSNIRQSAGQVSQVDASVLSTLLFDFDVAYLPNDVTMRDLFIALPVLLLMPFGLGKSMAARMGLALCLVSTLFILDPLGIASRLPLFSVSRFHLADFRAPLHLGMCLLAARGYDSLRDGHASTRQAVAASLASLAGVTALLVLGWRLGVGQKEVGAIAAGAVLVLAIAWCLRALVRAHHWQVLAGIVLVALTAWSGIRHVERNARVWKVPRSDAAEIAQYGAPLSQLVGTNRYDALVSRPERLIFSTLPADRGQLYDARYGMGWVSEKFSAFGYSDLKGAKTYQHFYQGAQQPEGSVVRQQIDWLLRPSMLILDTRSMEGTLAAARNCQVQVCGAGAAADARIKPEMFLENGETWWVDSPTSMRVTQNETWYPGWQSVLCEGNSCRPGPLAEDALGLRSWQLPPGRYRFVSFYRPPGWQAARSIAWGAALALFILFLLHFVKRFQLVSSTRQPPHP